MSDGRMNEEGFEAVERALERLEPMALPGEVARAVRLARGLSLKDLAARIAGNPHFTTVAKLETGKMKLNMDWAYALAAALDVPSNIFHMPYDTQNKQVAFPVYTSLAEAADHPKGTPFSYDVYKGKEKDIFGFSMVGQPDLCSLWSIITAIVNPAYKDLKHGSVYLVSHAEAQDGQTVIYRERPSGAILLSWPILESRLQRLPADLVVYGEVIELRRGLVSRNS